VSPGVEFEEVYRLYADRVFRYSMTILRNHADAEEATAETFVRAYRAYNRSAVEADRVMAWLFAIARNTAISQLRRGASRGRLMQLLHLERQPVRDATQLAEVGDDLRRVLDAMASMKPRERHLLQLRFGAGMSLSEIAAATGLNEPAAGMATRRATERLRLLVEGRGD
jgi:RNA polymerase sigma factor (sigma-70 family)